MNPTFQFTITASSTDFDRDGSTIKNGLRKAVQNLDSIELISLYNTVCNGKYVIKDDEIKRKEISYEEVDNDINVMYGATTLSTRAREEDDIRIGTHDNCIISGNRAYNSGSDGIINPLNLQQKNIEYHDVSEEEPIYRELKILLDVNIDVNEILPHQIKKIIQRIIEADKTIIECDIVMTCKNIPNKDLREKIEKQIDTETYELTSENAHMEYDLDDNRTLIERVSLRMRAKKP